MIKVNKNLSAVPDSLNSELTNRRRSELVDNGQYIDSRIYNGLYRQSDIKDELENICHNKCVYCEKDVGDSFYHIEHYRPKSVYYWLAFSWDNLMICCDKCNIYKSDNFETDGEMIAFVMSHLENIHNLTGIYNETERPKLVNPETEDVEDRLVFTEKGVVDSSDERVKYTIATCRLDRISANERRKKIFDDVMKRSKADSENIR